MSEQGFAFSLTLNKDHIIISQKKKKKKICPSQLANDLMDLTSLEVASRVQLLVVSPATIISTGPSEGTLLAPNHRFVTRGGELGSFGGSTNFA